MHDDTSYLDNGQWLEDSMVWFDIEIAGITILGVSLYVVFSASEKHYDPIFISLSLAFWGREREDDS